MEFGKTPMSLKLKAMTIAGYSTARLATWYFIEEYRLLFDAGDGVAASLGGKCEKVKHVFLSHADRDHLGGLMQFYQLAARSESPPHFYYPKDCGSFPALRDFLQRFDPNLTPCIWTPVEAGMRITVGKKLFVEVGQNDHIALASRGTSDLVKSLDFTLIKTDRKLRAEFLNLPGEDISRLRSELGD